MNAQKRIPWLSGFAITAMLLTMSGCLEGRVHEQDYTPYTDPTVAQVSLGEDLLNSAGVTALQFPIGSVTQDLNVLYPQKISVSTEQELAAALTVASGEKPHWIEMQTSIVIEHDLTLSGDVLITATTDRDYLRVMPGVVLHIAATQKAASDVAKLKSCLSTRWMDLATSSSLKLQVPLDGSFKIETQIFFHFMMDAGQATGSSISMDAASKSRTLVSVRGDVSRVSFDITPSNVWFAYTNDTDLDTPAADQQNSRVLSLMTSSPYRDPSHVNTSVCQNLKRKTPYSYDDYISANAHCEQGTWFELTNSFATCGGAK